ncbi:MAG: STT3 domain-containing protein [Methanomassiliicoccales archaeon]|jgi:dolichyl-diphosphooligosaccharide--protein glycosyltransferase|nr:STT3 domain-containing protein [Methanomassiliicoccales archaeon]
MEWREEGRAGLVSRNPFRSLSSLKSRFGDSWLGKNWQTVVVLLMIFLIALFMRSYFGYSLSVENGFLVSGGSDSYYHQRVIDHVTSTGTHLVNDPLLNYPMGMRNPRPPLYDWSIAVSGMLISALTGIAIADAVGYSLIFSTAIWGALTVVPVYLIGRTAFGKKAGIIAAFLFAIMPGHITRSVLSFADHDPMVLFFGVCSFYFLLTSLKAIQGDRWVENWRSFKSIRTGIVDYFRKNWVSTIYAALAGISLAAVGMIWTGYAYLLIIILAYFLVQILINRFRNTDSMGVLITIIVTLLVAFAIMAPVYYQMNYWEVWFDVPFYLFAAAAIVGVIFVTTRDYPWTLVLPSFTLLAAISLLVLSVLAPSIFEAIITGQGYFVKSKLYSTISEAQAPSFSDLALSFGAVTFWLSFAGVVIAAIKIRRNVAAYFVFIVIWTTISMFMAVMAARFMFNASPAFAVTSGWVLALIIESVRFSDISRAFSASAGIGFFSLLRRAIKIRHIFAAFFLAFLIVLPNAWGATDAAIPSELKAQYDKQVYDIMPNFAKPSSYDAINGSNWYFGAFTYSMPLPTQYWPAAWSWFRTVDSDVLPASARPAFLSWWDYGFEAIQAGQHPTVADNFQNAYQFAGNFIMSQNETVAVALFVVRILEKTGLENETIAQVLVDHGVDYTKLRDIMVNPDRYVEVVKNHPEIYGPRDADLSPANAKYSAASVELSKAGLENLVKIYNELRQLTGVDISYFAIDSRLFPFTALSANIFYAPAKLADYRIDTISNSPIDFFEIKAIDSEGGIHDLANVTSDMTIVSYQIVYKEMFYNSMLYRAFMGYGPYDIGETSQGLPGLTGTLASYPPMQGWNMTHFRMVYRTAYYNPFPPDQVKNHSNAWRAVSYDEAIELREKIERGELQGTVDASANALLQGVVFLQYYDGAIVDGTVTTNSGLPYPDLWVTVLDEYGIPHQTVKTDADGHYEVIVPFGKVTLVFSYGDLDLRTQIATELSRTTFNVSYDQAMRKKIDADNDGKWDYYLTKNAIVQGSAVKGKVYWDMDGDGAYTSGTDTIIEGARVIVENESRGLRYETISNAVGYGLYGLPPMNSTIYAVLDNHSFGHIQVDLRPMGNITKDIGLKPSSLSGTATSAEGKAASGLSLQIIDTTSGKEIIATTDSNGHFSVGSLLSGHYLLKTRDTSYTVVPDEISLAEGENKTTSLTVYGSMKVSGRVIIGSSVVSNATISFVSETGEFWTKSDSKGIYDVTLPIGNYSVFCLVIQNGETYVSLAALNSSNSAMNYNIRLMPANIIDLHVSDSMGSVSNAEILMRSRANGATLEAVTNATGLAKIIIPQGTYFVYIKGNEKAYWGDIYFDSSRRMNLVLSSAASISGVTWYDANNNAVMDSGEQISGVKLKLQDRNGRVIEATSDSLGGFSFVVPSGNSYDLSISKEGYASNVLSFPLIESSTSIDVKLVPLNRTITGTVYYESTPVAGIAVKFVSSTGSVFTANSGSSGAFSISLQPGDYEVVVDQNVSSGSNATKYQYSSSIDVIIGADPAPLRIDLVKRVRVYGSLYPERTGATKITFSGPEERTITTYKNFDLYLAEGEYSVYALNDQAIADYAFFDRIYIDASASPLNLTTSIAKTVRGSIYFEGSPFSYVVPVTIRNDAGATMRVDSYVTGIFEAILPYGNYTAEVDYHTKTRIGLDMRYVRYTGNTSLVVPSSAVVIVVLERAYDNATLSGSISDSSGSLVPATIDFISMSSTAMSTVTTSEIGSYAVSVAPGNYSVYARQVGGQGVFLGVISVPPQTNKTFNLTLLPGFRFAGETLKGYTPGNATIEITSIDGAKLSAISSPSGSFEIVLPSGRYGVKFTSSGMEKGVLVNYYANTSIDLITDVSRAITMEKIVKRGVDLQWNEAEKTALGAGQTAVYNIRIINKGNVPDTFKLQAQAANWNVVFSQDTVSVDFGYYNSQLVTVCITPSAGVYVSHQPIKITATSTNNASVQDSVSIDAIILPYYSLNLKFDKPYQVNGTPYSYSIKLENNGNDEDTIDITVANRVALAELGWNAELRLGDENPVDNLTVTLLAGKVKYFDLLLTPTRENPNPNIEVIISAESQKAPNAYALLTVKPPLPVVLLPSDGVKIGGENVYFEPAAIPVETIALAGAALAAFVVFILMGIHRGVFRRRKR